MLSLNITGIIAEYNPFHLGHQYQIRTLRKEQNPDYVVVAISGDFLQRGTPAFLDKYTRAHMALLQGADLVFELPIGIQHDRGVMICPNSLKSI